MVLDAGSVVVFVAATGPATAFVEAAAASVGAGIVLGGFLGGLGALAVGWEGPRRERSVFLVGSLAGLAMAMGLVVEATLR